MNRRILWALIIIACTTIVLVLNTGSVTLNLLFFDITLAKAFALLAFVAVGVAIGLLLK